MNVIPFFLPNKSLCKNIGKHSSRSKGLSSTLVFFFKKKNKTKMRKPFVLKRLENEPLLFKYRQQRHCVIERAFTVSCHGPRRGHRKASRRRSQKAERKGRRQRSVSRREEKLSRRAGRERGGGEESEARAGEADEGRRRPAGEILAGGDRRMGPPSPP